MLKRNLDIVILMQNDGSYEVTVREPESGSVMIFAHEAGSMYKAASLEDVTGEIRSWIIMLDDERGDLV